MMMPSRIPVTGADFFTIALDYDMRRAGMAGNICQLVMTVDGPISTVCLHAALRKPEFSRLLANVRLIRHLPFTRPYWRIQEPTASLPVFENDIVDDTDPISNSGVLSFQRNIRIDPAREPGLAIQLVRKPKAGAIVLTWHHALMDARGAESLLRYFNTIFENEGGAIEATFFNGVNGHYSKTNGISGLATKGRFARRSLFTIDNVTRHPIATLLPDGQKGVGGRVLYRVISFGNEETTRIDCNCDLVGAGFRKSLFYLAAAIRSLNAIRLERGLKPMAYVIPVPQDLRRRGLSGPAFGNWFSFLYFRIEPEDVDCIRRTIASLKRQMAEQVRDEIPQSFAAVMELSRSLPLGIYSYFMKRPSKGQIGSFIFSDTGQNLKGLQTFLGAPVTGIIHLAPPPVPPGVAVISGRFKNRFYMVISWMEGCLNAGEEELFEKRLRADLLAGGDQ